MKNVAVIGAGASGLMAAYACASNGNNVIVFEKNEKCGKKIYITGKGRCNFTNNCPPDEFLQNIISNSKFATGAIYNFSPQRTMQFFEDGGLRLKTERGNRVFPVSDKASDVTKCLEKYCIKAGVQFKFGEKVLNISNLNSTMFDIITHKDKYSVDNVIVCTGGLSYPLTGSTGDGYKFAQDVGHKIIQPKPSLCGFNLKGDYYKKLQGLALKNVKLNVYIGSKKKHEFFGEMLFTHFGISGPIVLSASSFINRYDLNTVKLSLDLKPALSEEQLDARILKDFERKTYAPNPTIIHAIAVRVPDCIIPYIANKAVIMKMNLCRSSLVVIAIIIYMTAMHAILQPIFAASVNVPK